MRTTVKIEIDRLEAIRCGNSEYGPQFVELSDSDLAALEPWEKDILLMLPYNGDVYDVTQEPSTKNKLQTSQWGFPGVKEALKKWAAARERIETEKEADLRAIIDRVRNMRYADLLSVTGHRIVEKVDDKSIPWEDPRLQSVKADLDQIVAANIAASRAVIDAGLAKMRANPDIMPDLAIYSPYPIKEHIATQAALTSSEEKEIALHVKNVERLEKEEFRMALSEAHEEIKQFALSGAAGDHARHAASLDYDVQSLVFAHIKNELIALFGKPDVAGEGSSVYMAEWEWSERASPSEQALALQAAISSAVAGKIGRPAAFGIKVSRVQKIRSADGTCVRTGVVITIVMPSRDSLEGRYEHLLYFAE